MTQRTCLPRLVVATVVVIGSASFARADIFQWEYINPANPSQGKQQSTTLAPDGAGVDAVPGAKLSGRNLTMAYLVGAELMNANGILTNLNDADLSQSKLTKANFGGATLTGADLSHTILTDAYFGETAFSCGDDPCIAPGATLTGADFAEANARGATFRGANLTGADFTGANVQGASFSKWLSILFYGSGITLSQLYSTASYEAHDLTGLGLTFNVLTGWNFAAQNLTNANFDFAELTDADFVGADVRGASFDIDPFLGGTGLTPAVTTNLIRPNGHIDGLGLNASGLLVVRDYDGSIPITVDQHLAMGPGGALRMVFEADAWDSTISFALGIPVSLGGTLELTFTDDVNLASQVGRTFDLFDWTGVNPTGQFAVSSPYTWDLSNLYTNGEVTLTAVPEAGPIALAVTVCCVFLLRRQPRPPQH